MQHLHDSGAGSLAGSVTLELTESVMAVWLAADAALEAVAEVEMMVFNGAVGVLTAGGAREDQICTPISKSQLLLGIYRGRLDGSFHVCSLFKNCSRIVHILFTLLKFCSRIDHLFSDVAVWAQGLSRGILHSTHGFQASLVRCYRCSDPRSCELGSTTQPTKALLHARRPRRRGFWHYNERRPAARRRPRRAVAAPALCRRQR